MIAKHLVCDSCGKTTLEPKFDQAYCNIDGNFDYNTIIGEGMLQTRTISNTNWTRHAFPNPKDTISITFSDYCNECNPTTEDRKL